MKTTLITRTGALAALVTLAAIPGLASAQAATDVAKGKAQFARCMSCHSVDAAKPRGIGPNLGGVVGREAGKLPGYRYTPAMAASKFKWTPEKLDAFIAKPRAVVPGTNMVFAGMADPAARKALVAYLASTKK